MRMGTTTGHCLTQNHMGILIKKTNYKLIGTQMTDTGSGGPLVRKI